MTMLYEIKVKLSEKKKESFSGFSSEGQFFLD